MGKIAQVSGQMWFFKGGGLSKEGLLCSYVWKLRYPSVHPQFVFQSIYAESKMENQSLDNVFN